MGSPHTRKAWGAGGQGGGQEGDKGGEQEDLPGDLGLAPAGEVLPRPRRGRGSRYCLAAGGLLPGLGQDLVCPGRGGGRSEPGPLVSQGQGVGARLSCQDKGHAQVKSWLGEPRRCKLSGTIEPGESKEYSWSQDRDRSQGASQGYKSKDRAERAKLVQLTWKEEESWAAET